MAVRADGAYVEIGGLKVHQLLAKMVEETVCPGTGFTPAYFWRSLNQLVEELLPELDACLIKRDTLQAQIDEFYTSHKAAGYDLSERHNRPLVQEFLKEIGYLLPDGEPASVTTQYVDPEIAHIPAPQLVVPSDNARYVLNALNARWGSLFDALYGFDVIPRTAIQNEQKQAEGYNPLRGTAVIEFANGLLDEIIPLLSGSWGDAVRIWPRYVGTKKQLVVLLGSGETTGLKYPSQFVGFSGYLGPPHGKSPAKGAEVGDVGRIFLKQNNLHVILEIDRLDSVGSTNPSGIKDVILESALSAIIDMEDSVAAVDTEDKVRIYSHINGIFRGTLEAPFIKGGKALTRSMNKDIWYRDQDGRAQTIPGRALCLVRTVGHHMFSDAVLTSNNRLIPEGFLDTFITAASAIHDLRGQGDVCNSRTGSIYIVKPKMHGPDEVSLTCRIFTRTEEFFGLRRNTIKVGIMDEERRTSVNLQECLRIGSERVFFINTGFLDRTGDEIHTCMAAGVVVPKTHMKQQAWIKAYEQSNVDVGIASGLQGKGQIGKGMWAKPDSMKAMLESKISELLAGASCAWVPSPTAATLHAIHYHRCDVMARQAQLSMREPAKVETILEPPLLKESLSKEAIQHELRENVQSILGYVVRWVDLGVGCSKVPDLSNIGLMEDRATLRISSQLLANWLAHGVISKEELHQVYQEMASVVDQQNAQDRAYKPMSGNIDTNIAYKAALKLVVEGQKAPNGYTEPTLHEARRLVKSQRPSRL
jgi:malate synthase